MVSPILPVCMAAVPLQREKNGLPLSGCMWAHLDSVRQHKRRSGVTALMEMIDAVNGQLLVNARKMLATC